ncbi:unnamed protein product [Amoebophrya sp. A25]|nr:unnamed protein product [Amoebophrya sp. A25]|eukprot:GSA25T00001760001.1
MRFLGKRIRGHPGQAHLRDAPACVTPAEINSGLLEVPRVTLSADLDHRYRNFLREHEIAAVDIENEIRTGAVKVLATKKQVSERTRNAYKAHEATSNLCGLHVEAADPLALAADRSGFPPALFEEQVLRYPKCHFDFQSLVRENLLRVDGFEQYQGKSWVSTGLGSKNASTRRSSAAAPNVPSVGLDATALSPSTTANSAREWQAAAQSLHNRVRCCKPLMDLYEAFIAAVIGPQLIEDIYSTTSQRITERETKSMNTSDTSMIAKRKTPGEENDSSCSSKERGETCSESMETGTGDNPATHSAREEECVTLLYQYPPTLRVFCCEAIEVPAKNNSSAATENYQDDMRSLTVKGPGEAKPNECLSATGINRTTAAATKERGDDAAAATNNPFTTGGDPSKDELDARGPPMRPNEQVDAAAPRKKYRSLGRMHNDLEYNHQMGEVNYWMPLSDTNIENTMWVESQYLKADWRPILLSPGETAAPPVRRYSGCTSPAKSAISAELALKQTPSKTTSLDSPSTTMMTSTATRNEDGESPERNSSSQMVDHGCEKNSSPSGEPASTLDAKNYRTVTTTTEYAEVLRFHGTSCRHFTRRNGSGVIRVSMDFRCALESHFDPNFRTAFSNHQHERRKMRFKLNYLPSSKDYASP